MKLIFQFIQDIGKPMQIPPINYEMIKYYSNFGKKEGLFLAADPQLKILYLKNEKTGAKRVVYIKIMVKFMANLNK